VAGVEVEEEDPMTLRRFPDDFVWGVATAGHQNEGDNVDSDIWFMEQQSPSVFREPSGKACNGWELWDTDLDLAAGLGLNAYRFSVEWARVEPHPGDFSEGALAHYEAIVDRCRQLGLAPVVTFNHFAAPHWFASRGGFLDERAPDTFARYCSRVMEAFGDRIAYAVTMNEPNLPRLLAWIDLPQFVRDLERATLEAAARSAGVDRYCVGNVVLPEDFDAMQEGLSAGHRAAKAAIKGQRDDLPVGLSIAMIDDQLVGDDPTFRDRKRSEVYDHWLRLAADDDFVGVQNYERRWYDGTGEVDPDPTAPKNDMGSAIAPDSLAGAVRYAHAQAGVAVLVTEHGISAHDDTLRAGFIEPALAGLLGAIDDDVPVIGYMHWTLMDNFEWIFGYESQLGLVEVDRSTFARTPKPSADVYRRIVRSNAVTFPTPA
jgi:beta-glucosidase